MENGESGSSAMRRESRKQDRRQAIIDAACASFLENGYAGTSMSGLLKSLGGSKATLWGYFRSKDELFGAVVEDISRAFRAELEGVLSAELDLETSLTRFCRAFLEKITSTEGAKTWRLVVAESGRFPEVGKIFYDQAASRPQAALQAYFARQIAAGKLLDEDPALMAEALINLCTGQHTRQLWGFDKPTDAEKDEKASAFARWFLKAFALPS